MKVAIVHDYLTQRGGAERVVLSLHRLFPDAPIFTAIYEPTSTFPEFAECEIRTSVLQRVPHRFMSGRALLPLYPIAFDTFRLRGYDLVISSSSGFAHGVRAGTAAHLCYCYTPPRFLYRTPRYLESVGRLGTVAGYALAPVLAALRQWDARASRRPDSYVAVSHVAAARVRALYGRACPVVYPPVHFPSLPLPGSDPPPRIRHLATGPFVLVVSRLLPYKRVDLAIEACASVGARLVVVGTGPMDRELRACAVRRSSGAPGSFGVEFLTTADERELGWLLANCTAVVQAGEEDLGLVPLEANAASRPAVAFAAGGALETVADGTTGILFAEQTPDSLAKGLHAVEERAWDQSVLRAQAERFSETAFHDGIRATVEELFGGGGSPAAGAGAGQDDALETAV
jgi:glycosyltransferase involved in cell wall biosynthesis